MKTLCLFFFLAASSVCFGNDKDIIDLVHRWNNIHNYQNTNEFKGLYASQVLFYGKYTSNEKCTQRKTKFLNKNFSQDIISPIRVEYYSSGTIKCLFTKQVTYKKVVKKYECYLLVEKMGSDYRITGESDLETDAKLNVALSLGEIQSAEEGSSKTPYIVLLSGGLVAGGILLNRRRRKKQLTDSEIDSMVPTDPLPIVDVPTKETLSPEELVTKVKAEVLSEINTKQPEVIDPKQKGDAFERYVVSLFNKDSGRFRLKEWRGDKMADNGFYALSNHLPDMEWAFVENGREHRFATECKWRKEFVNGSIDWAKDYQIKNYLGYQRKSKVPVFVAIGVGGTPSQPEMLFLPKLEFISSYPSLYQSYLKEYIRNPGHRFYYNPRQKMLH